MVKLQCNIGRQLDETSVGNGIWSWKALISFIFSSACSCSCYHSIKPRDLTSSPFVIKYKHVQLWDRENWLQKAIKIAKHIHTFYFPLSLTFALPHALPSFSLHLQQGFKKKGKPTIAFYERLTPAGVRYTFLRMPAALLDLRYSTASFLDSSRLMCEVLRCSKQSQVWLSALRGA